MTTNRIKIDFDTPLEQLTYETALSHLELIVRALETEGSTLQEALALFERGQVLMQHCVNLLDQAELRVQQITEPTISTKNPDA